MKQREKLLYASEFFCFERCFVCILLLFSENIVVVIVVMIAIIFIVVYVSILSFFSCNFNFNLIFL